MVIGLLSVPSKGLIFPGHCPQNVPKFKRIGVLSPSYQYLRIVNYLRVNSEINHMFYPTSEENLSKLIINVAIYNDALIVHKSFSKQQICLSDMVELNGKGYFNNQAVSTGSVTKYVADCGPQWDMYQIFRVDQELVLWGCADSPSDDRLHEQGLWIMAVDIKAPVNLTKILEVLSFTSIHPLHFTIKMAYRKFHNTSDIGKFQCGNGCKSQRNSPQYWHPLVGLICVICIIGLATICQFKSTRRIQPVANLIIILQLLK